MLFQYHSLFWKTRASNFDIKSKKGRNFNGNDGLDDRVFALVKLKDPDTDL